MEPMNYISRKAAPLIESALARGKGVLLLGPRQTGKTTLLERIPKDLTISLAQAALRQRYEKNPDLLRLEVEQLAKGKRSAPLVVLDEIQKVPALLDVVQDLIDRKKALFVLCGSSARKLWRGAHINMLPGRVVSVRMDPLMLEEKPDRTLESRLLYGDLPGIVLSGRSEDQETDLSSYVTTYLVFLKEYPKAKRGYVVCRTLRRYALTERIEAIPWQELPDIVSEGSGNQPVRTHL